MEARLRIKRINALAEEAGRRVAALGLELAPPDELLAAARAAQAPKAAIDELIGLFAEIEAQKTALAAQRKKPWPRR